MDENLSDLAAIGARVSGERERLGLNQDEFARLAGTNRQTLGPIENGKQAPKVGYLLAWGRAGVDPAYVLTGTHSADRLAPDRGDLLALVDRLAPDQRQAVVTIVGGLAGAPSRPAAELPSEPALARALEGALAVYPDLRGGELAQALARHLPSVLASAGDARPDQAARGPAPRDSQSTDRREPRPARRT